MAENLRTDHYLNGDIIPNDTDWCSLPSGAWCYQNNDISLNAVYGKLYNFNAVTDPRKICPSGWHVPDLAELITLWKYIGPDGTPLMLPISDWGMTFDSTANVTGFSVVPGGNIGCQSGSNNFQYSGEYWTSKSTGALSNYFYWIGPHPNYAVPIFNYYYDLASYGRSCRCIKD